MYIWKQFFQNFRRKRGLYETRLYYSFYRTFLCSGISFPGSFATGICCVLPDNASLFSGPHLPQDLPSCQTIAQKRSGRRKVSGSSEAGTVTERTGAAVCFQKAGDSRIPAVYHPETRDTSELPENERI